MTSIVSICNQAISHTGISKLIDDIAEPTVEARQCNFHYAIARDFVLSEHAWQFANEEVTLSDVGSPPPNWLYRYRYPTDCSTARKLVYCGNRTPSRPHPFQIRHDDTGKKSIVTDLEEAVLIYTKRVTDVALYDQYFADLVAANLATRIAMPLTKNPEITTEMQRLYANMKDVAIVRDLNQQQDDQAVSSEIAAERLG